MKNEIWKQSKLAENYEISNLGNIRHLRRKINLNFRDNGNGYKLIGVRENGKGKNYYVHRLVAIEFLDNPNNYPQINHKDGNKSNNKVENLEWCSISQNIKHAYNIELKIPSDKQKNVARNSILNMSEESKLKSLRNRMAVLKNKTRKERQAWAISFSKPIKCIELNRIFLSTVRASEKLGIGISAINRCLNGKSKTSGGYHWQYLKRNEVSPECQK
jgi:hypothetical protein